ncbi:hypothetical protein [Actinoallomurus acaciae]|uniref:Uncharacterized protein n=1 Tax=Actinoallomurus acaciae TaxID=502577 RepID=A0ABV5YTK7_9ACTN
MKYPLSEPAEEDRGAWSEEVPRRGVVRGDTVAPFAETKERIGGSCLTGMRVALEIAAGHATIGHRPVRRP